METWNRSIKGLEQCSMVDGSAEKRVVTKRNQHIKWTGLRKLSARGEGEETMTEILNFS